MSKRLGARKRDHELGIDPGTIGTVITTAGGLVPKIFGGSDDKDAVGSLAAAIAETEKGTMAAGQRIAPKAVELYVNSGGDMPKVERFIDSQLGYSYQGPYSGNVYPWNLIHRHVRREAQQLQQNASMMSLSAGQSPVMRYTLIAGGIVGAGALGYYGYNKYIKD